MLVPLCGKSTDLWWLAERGYAVTGVELSPLACAALFHDRGVVPQRDGDRYRHDNLTVVCGDFFAETGTYDAVYDRAAVIALPPEVRVRYAAHLAARLAPGGRMLAVTLAYPQALRDGPPFSVDAAELARLFPQARREQLHRALVTDDPRFTPLGAFDLATALFF